MSVKNQLETQSEVNPTLKYEFHLQPDHEQPQVKPQESNTQ